MISFSKTIFTGFAPNLTIKEFFLAFSFLFFPWKWKKKKTGIAVRKVEKWLENFLGIKYGFTFDSGRSALFFSLKALGIKKDDEVLVQAYTCVVVVNAIKWLGAKPVFVDIDENLNMDFHDLENKITQKTKVLIIQHTFGLSANIDQLVGIARKNNLRIIEDCAHALGAKYNGRKVGTFGDASIFSFGSNKLISCVRGGAVCTNDSQLSERLKSYQLNLPTTKNKEISKNLFHFIVFFLAKPIYNFGIGKIILVLFVKISFLPKILTKQEKMGEKDENYPTLLPNCLAEILLCQLKNFDENIEHRKEIAKFYEQNLSKSFKRQKDEEGRVWLYYPIFVKDPFSVAKKIKKENNIILGLDWTGSTIVPRGVEQENNTNNFSCPRAGEMVNQVLYLPTDKNINKKKAKRIVESLLSFT